MIWILVGTVLIVMGLATGAWPFGVGGTVFIFIGLYRHYV